jgi:hypothetical protein
MKRNSIVLVVLLMITFSSCGPGFKNNKPPQVTAVPGTDFVQQVATIVAESLTKTAGPATPAPIPVPSSLPAISTSQKIYLNPTLGIQFIYPDDWHLQEITESQPATVIVTSFDPANPPHKLEWNDQTVSMQLRLLPAGSVPQNLGAWLESAQQTAVAAQLSLFEEEHFLIANQPAARLTLVSGSGGIIHQILTIQAGRNYEINIKGNLDLGKSVLSTLRAYSSSGLKPSEGDTPAAGICLEPQDDQVAIVLGLDQSGLPLAGRCVVLLPTQRIKLINQSDGLLVIQFADYSIDLPVGTEILLDKPVGEYFAPGVHSLPKGPALWLQALEAMATPVATMSGPVMDNQNSSGDG